jgi:acetyl-CoA carboxylase biotin carboxyl carrier protein
MVDFDLIKKLIKTLKEEGITSLSLEEKGVKIEVKNEHGVVSHAVSSKTGHAPVASEKGGKTEPDLEDGLAAVTSPMVGTFYRAPSPDAAPFVEAGQRVETGKTVCIVEAMKLFNEIETDISGTVEKILVENGQPVEYGQKLILIKKD